MLRSFVATIVVSCFAATGWAQSPAAPTAPATSAPSKAVAKKAAPKKGPSKTKPAAKRSAAAESGPCRLGVISTIGDRFNVQKVGLTVFENEGAEIPVDWGFNDIVLARVRAATGADPAVRRIAYPNGAFEPFYNPKSRFIPDPGERLPAIVRNVTPNVNCERFLVVTTSSAEVPGTNVQVKGIGAYNRGIGSLLRHSHLFANISFSLIDGRTYEEIDRQSAILRARMAEGIKLTEDPLTKLDNSSFPEPPAAVSGSAELREKTRALVTATLDRLLPIYLKEE